MYALSTEARSELTRSHRIGVRADVLRDGAVVATGLRVVDGRVSVDRTAAVRRRLALRLVDPDGTILPDSPADPLAPYGNELQVYRGVYLPSSGQLEQIPLGVFRISADDVEDTGARTLAIDGYDRSRTIARNRFTTPYVIAAGTNYVTAITSLLTNRMPGLVCHAVPTSLTTPLLVFAEEGDPWAEATAMARAIGYELYFDVAGEIQLRPEPDPTSDPVAWTYTDDTASTLLSLGNRLDDEPGYNGAVVFGEGTGNSAPVRAEAWDDDPTSPTYYLGRYGRNPAFLRTSYVTTTAQAQAAADAMLRRVLGTTEQLRITALVNPAHEGGDVVSVARAAAGVNELYVFDAFEIPLTVAGTMPVTTRKRRAAA